MRSSLRLRALRAYRGQERSPGALTDTGSAIRLCHLARSALAWGDLSAGEHRSDLGTAFRASGSERVRRFDVATSRGGASVALILNVAPGSDVEAKKRNIGLDSIFERHDANHARAPESDRWSRESSGS